MRTKFFALLSILSLIFTSSAGAVSIGNDLLNMGGADGSAKFVTPFNNPHAAFPIYLDVAAGPASFYHFNVAGTLGVGAGGGAVYKVTAGKTARIISLCWYQIVSTADQTFQLASATNNFADAAGAGSITGGVFQFGAAAANYAFPSSYNQECEAFQYDFGSATYPAIQAHNGNRLGVHAWVYEF